MWADLAALTREQFVNELDCLLTGKRSAFSVPKAKTKSTNSPQKMPSDDRPVTRIAFVLQEEKKLSTEDAQVLVVQTLADRGYAKSDIPETSGQSLEDWLEELLLHIPSSEVMDAAKKAR